MSSPRAIDRVRRARLGLLAAAAGAALLWGFGAALVVLAAFGFIDLLTPLSLGLRAAAVAVAGLAGLVAAGVVLWRARHAGSLVRVALYIEERVPALEFALATAVGAPAGAAVAALEQAVERVDPRGVLRAPALTALARPAAMLAVALVALAALPVGVRTRVLRPEPGDVLARPPNRAPLASRLAPIVVRIVPPGYARQALRTTENPSDVQGLVGSRVDVLGRGASALGLDSLGALLGERHVAVSAVGDTWSVSVAMPLEPAVLRLSDRRFDRLLTLEPVIDAAPSLTFVSPVHDTTIRTVHPGDVLLLAADASDDIGLARARFELMHTTGSGERFETRRWTVDGAALSGARTSRLAATLALDSLRLGPGDVLHVRALAWDENTLSGPDTGVSDTRTIHVAAARDPDSAAVKLTLLVAIDTSVLSQRMLILRAETLLVRQARISADSFQRTSERLAAQQRRLRDRVESVIGEIEDLLSEEEAETPPPDPAVAEGENPEAVAQTVVSRLLHQASSAMFDAGLELGLARVRAALPHMYTALRLLDQARGTNRLYLRGSPPKVVVDVDRIRLRGTDSARAAPRLPRPAAPDPRRALLGRLDRALRLLERAPAEGADSLTVVRVSALTVAPDAAASLGRAIEAVRGGRDARAALVQARRRLERATEAASVLPEWQGGR